jgi:hypothetical protein
MKEYSEVMPYRPSSSADEAMAFYEYKKKDPSAKSPGFESQAYDMAGMLKGEEKSLEDELLDIEHQVAERERIKRRNVCFLEEQRQKLESMLNTLECFSYRPAGIVNSVKSKLMTQMVQVELKKGEEYVTAFRDVQRLEEQKRKLLSEGKEAGGWSGWS